MPNTSTSLEPGSDLLNLNLAALGLLAFTPFAVMGNLLVIASVARERCLQHVTNYFVVNMAAADLIVASVVLPFAVYALIDVDRWRLGENGCMAVIFLDVISTTASIYSMVAISADRWYSLKYHSVYAIKTGSRNYKIISGVAICLIWITAWIVGIPVLQSGVVEVKSGECIFADHYFAIYSSVISYFCPALIILGFHLVAVHIRYKQLAELRVIATSYMGDYTAPEQTESANGLLEQTLFENKAVNQDVENEKVEQFELSNLPVSSASRRSSNHGKRISVTSFGFGHHHPIKARRLKYWLNRNGKHFYHGKVMTKSERRDRNTTKTMTAVVTTFLLFWLPFFTLHLCDAACSKAYDKSQCVPPLLLHIATWLGYISCGLSPMIYTTLNPDFRKAFRNIGQRIICYTKVKQEDPKRSESFFANADIGANDDIGLK